MVSTLLVSGVWFLSKCCFYLVLHLDDYMPKILFNVVLKYTIFLTGSKMLEQPRLIKWICTRLFALVTLSELLWYPFLCEVTLSLLVET